MGTTTSIHSVQPTVSSSHGRSLPPVDEHPRSARFEHVLQKQQPSLQLHSIPCLRPAIPNYISNGFSATVFRHEPAIPGCTFKGSSTSTTIFRSSTCANDEPAVPSCFSNGCSDPTLNGSSATTTVFQSSFSIDSNHEPAVQSCNFNGPSTTTFSYYSNSCSSPTSNYSCKVSSCQEEEQPQQVDCHRSRT